MFHAFEKYLPENAEKGAVTITVNEGTTLQELLENLGIPDDRQKLILINGLSQGACTSVKENIAINEGDTISIFPPVAGG
jgi:molybdopterin converting factor small subunit